MNFHVKNKVKDAVRATWRPAAAVKKINFFSLFQSVFWSAYAHMQTAGRRIERKEVESSSSDRQFTARYLTRFRAPTVIGVVDAPGGENFAPPTTIASSYNPGGYTQVGKGGIKTPPRCGNECSTIHHESGGTPWQHLDKSNQMGFKKALFLEDGATKKFLLNSSTVVEELLVCPSSTTTWSITTSTAWRAKSRVVDSTYPSNFPVNGRSGGLRPSLGWLNDKGSPTPPPKEGELPWTRVLNRLIDNNLSLRCICLFSRYISRGLFKLETEGFYGPRAVVG